MTRETETGMDSREAAGGYLVGLHCTWHGYGSATIPDPRCPKCGCGMRVVSADAWRAEVEEANRKEPGFAHMMRWSRGRCFPDLDTLQNAYRQAMEGQS